MQSFHNSCLVWEFYPKTEGTSFFILFTHYKFNSIFNEYYYLKISSKISTFNGTDFKHASGLHLKTFTEKPFLFFTWWLLGRAKHLLPICNYFHLAYLWENWTLSSTGQQCHLASSVWRILLINKWKLMRPYIYFAAPPIQKASAILCHFVFMKYLYAVSEKWYDLLWEKIVLVIEKKFWNLRLMPGLF